MPRALIRSIPLALCLLTGSALAAPGADPLPPEGPVTTPAPKAPDAKPDQPAKPDTKDKAKHHRPKKPSTKTKHAHNKHKKTHKKKSKDAPKAGAPASIDKPATK